MEISYKKVGDYYIPEMVFPNAKLDKNWQNTCLKILVNGKIFTSIFKFERKF